MLRYTLRRLLGAIPTLLVIVTLAFVLLHAAPGGPFDSEKRMMPEIQRSIEAKYHLDEPLWRQYLRYLADLARGDLGPSFQYRSTSVNEIIAQGLPVDAVLGLTAMALALSVGGAVGVNAGLRHGTRWDYGSMALAVAGISTPVFVVAPLLILIFAIKLHWLPAGDWVRGSPSHLVLPAVALALPYTAYIARMMRASTIEVLNSPFIRTARAKGLSGARVVIVHALRNALIPVVTVIGLMVGTLLSGAILTETVFAWPGIGHWMVESVLRRDYPVVQGGLLLIAALVMLVNLGVDLTYGFLNPRIRR